MPPRSMGRAVPLLFVRPTGPRNHRHPVLPGAPERQSVPLRGQEPVGRPEAGSDSRSRLRLKRPAVLGRARRRGRREQRDRCHQARRASQQVRWPIRTVRTVRREPPHGRLGEIDRQRGVAPLALRRASGRWLMALLQEEPFGHHGRKRPGSQRSTRKVQRAGMSSGVGGGDRQDR